MKKILRVGWFATGLLLAGCGRGSPPAASANPPPPVYPTAAQPRLPTMKLWLGPEEMIAEIANNDTSRMTGMMFRTNMAENEGMLFVFPYPHQTAFWMKNTKIPLSAAYIGPDGNILEIHKLEPESTNSVVATSTQVQFVLETRQGWFARHHVGVGAAIRGERGSLSQIFFR